MMIFNPGRPYRNARKKVVNGITFHSRGEAGRYEFLLGELENERIKGLWIQHSFLMSFDDSSLIAPRVKGYTPTKYIVDFVILTNNGYVFEDYKRGRISRSSSYKFNGVMGKFGVKINIYQDDNHPRYYNDSVAYGSDPSLEGRALEYIKRYKVEKFLNGDPVGELTPCEKKFIDDPWAGFPPLIPQERVRLLKFIKAGKMPFLKEK